MPCPFVPVAGVGAVAGGAHTLFLQDRARRTAWLATLALAVGWTAYAIAYRRPPLRIALEAATVLALVAGSVRVWWLARHRGVSSPIWSRMGSLLRIGRARASRVHAALGAAPPAVAAESPAPSLSALLRDRTREAHERVETLASFNRRIVERLPQLAADAPESERQRLALARADYREAYRQFLLAAHEFEAALEARLAESPALAEAVARGYAAETHAPAALLRADLAHVFGAAAAAEAGVMPGIAPIRTLAELAGIEYVRRGSRAGAAVIGAAVRANLGLTREAGASFLLHYGRETRPVIEAFKRWLDGLPLAADEAKVAIARAIATFEAVGRAHQRIEERFAADLEPLGAAATRSR